jgi:2,3-dimethylmalate lyase
MSAARSIERWWAALESRGHLEIVTAYDCITARLVQEIGFDGIVLGGGATANFMYGLPDVGIVSTAEMLENARRMAASVDIPIIADVDDGGSTPGHILRTISLAEGSGVAGIMMEDVDSSVPKHLWNEAKGDWDFSQAVLYQLDTAVARLEHAIKARTNPRFVIMARTDALHTDPEHGLERAVERAQAYASAGADILFILGLSRDVLTGEFVRSLGCPLLFAEVGAVDTATRTRIFDAGASLFHGLLPIMAAYSAYKGTLTSLRDGTPPHFDREPWAVNRELLETLDLRGWTRHLTGA